MKKNIKKSGDFSFTLKLMFKANWRVVTFSMIMNIVTTASDVYFYGYFINEIFTMIEAKENFESFIVILSTAALLNAIVRSLYHLCTYYKNTNKPNIYKYVFTKIINKIQKYPLAKIEDSKFYNQVSRALEDTEIKLYTILNSITDIMGYLIAAFLEICLIIYIDYNCLIFVFVPLALSILVYRKTRKLFYEMEINKTPSRRNVQYIQRIFYEKKFVNELRLYNVKEILFKKHRDSFDKMYDIDLKYRKKLALYSVINNLAIRFFLYFGVLIYVAIKSLNGQITRYAPYLTMLIILPAVQSYVDQAITLLQKLMENTAFMKSLREFLEYGSNEDENRTVICDHNIGSITLQNVSFSYENSDRKVINDVSLKINKGEKIALVGYNGAGKTTLIKLILGLYNVSSGKILEDNNDIFKYNTKSYRDRFGVIMQDFQIFGLTLAENVLMRKPENEEERKNIITSLEKAQFGEVLKRLPNGIDTVLTKEFSKDGIGLSGGESQKVAIARVFAKDCDVLILDEPSSALDPISEYNMYNSIKTISNEKTVIFISHRLASTAMADKIYMMENGKIIEGGTHNELMKLNGKYAEMYNIQSKKYSQ